MKPPRAKLPWSDRLYLAGSAISDMVSGGNTFAAGRSDAFARQQEMQDQQDLLGLLNAARGASDPASMRQAELDYIAQHPRLASVGLDLLKPRAPIKAEEGSIYLDPDSYKPVYTAPQKKTLPSGYEWDDDTKGKMHFIPGGPGDPAVIDRNADARRITINTGGGGGLSSDGLDMAAQQYRSTGTLPPLGMGAAAVAQRQKIINRAAELAKADGQSAEAAIIAQSGYKASAQALAQLQKQHNSVAAFEKTFTQGVKYVRDASKRVGRSGSPLLNEWFQKGKLAATGDPNLSTLNTYINTVANEYAKISSGSMGNTPLSDSAREHAYDLINSAQNPQQLEAVLKALEAEVAAREKGFVDQEAELKAGMSMKPRLKYDPATGELK